MSEIYLSAHRSEHELARIARFLKDFQPGKRLLIQVDAAKKERTKQQCRYLNGVAYKLLSDHTGYERDDISEYLCGRYFGWVKVKCPKTPSNPEGFKDVPLRTTTTDENGKRAVLKWDVFGEYVAFVQRFGAKHGVFIPDPDPEWFMKEAA
ncbi:MAG TPA: hypothetical protein VGE22_16735 [Solimonas sp.]